MIRQSIMKEDYLAICPHCHKAGRYSIFINNVSGLSNVTYDTSAIMLVSTRNKLMPGTRREAYLPEIKPYCRCCMQKYGIDMNNNYEKSIGTNRLKPMEIVEPLFGPIVAELEKLGYPIVGVSQGHIIRTDAVHYTIDYLDNYSGILDPVQDKEDFASYEVEMPSITFKDSRVFNIVSDLLHAVTAKAGYIKVVEDRRKMVNINDSVIQANRGHLTITIDKSCYQRIQTSDMIRNNINESQQVLSYCQDSLYQFLKSLVAQLYSLENHT